MARCGCSRGHGARIALYLAATLLLWPAPAFAAPPDTSARAAVVIDARTGRVLWSRKSTQPRAIASTTKILTALVAVESGELDRRVSIDSTPPVGNGSLGLRPGDTLTRRQLIYAMLLKSANDAAYVLAADVAGDQKTFAADMNATAKEIGHAQGVNMRNPHGLPDGDHRGTALAVAHWSRRLLETPELAPVVAARRYRLGGRFGAISNTNWLLYMDHRVIGVKTGYTDAAGYCLAAAGRRPGATLIAVVLGCPTERARFTDASKLLRWAYDRYRTRRVVVGRRGYATTRLPEWGNRRLRAVAASEASATMLLGVPTQREVVALGALKTPVATGQPVGFIRVRQEGLLLATVPLVAAESVPTPSLWDRVRLWLGAAGRGRR